MPEPTGAGAEERRWTIYVCPECDGLVEPPGHSVYSSSDIAGHYHEIPNVEEEPYDRWYDAVLVEVVRVEAEPDSGGANEQQSVEGR